MVDGLSIPHTCAVKGAAGSSGRGLCSAARSESFFGQPSQLRLLVPTFHIVVHSMTCTSAMIAQGIKLCLEPRVGYAALSDVVPFLCCLFLNSMYDSSAEMQYNSLWDEFPF